MDDVSAAYRHWLYTLATVRKELEHLEFLTEQEREEYVVRRDAEYADARKMVSEVRGIPVEKVVIAPVEVALEVYSVWTHTPIGKH